MHLSRKDFGTLHGRPLELYTISNEQGVTVSITNFGGVITSIKTPDRHGEVTNIVLGYELLEEYYRDRAYLGSIVGRYANRISNGRYRLGGCQYRLVCNDGDHHLHGGIEGFNKKIWEVEPIQADRGYGIRLNLISPDGEEGYPGTLDVQVLYLVSAQNELIIEYSAATDRPTIINLTQHSYFNLAGSGTIYDHRIRINGSGYVAVDTSLIPSGIIKRVDGSIFDLREEQRIGELIGQAAAGERAGGGFDHTWVLDRDQESDQLAATLYHPGSGRQITVFTTEPGLQFYTGNSLGDSSTGPETRFEKHGGVCLEAQHFPDSPNHQAFPGVILEPGDRYAQTTRYLFSVRGT